MCNWKIFIVCPRLHKIKKVCTRKLNGIVNVKNETSYGNVRREARWCIVKFFKYFGCPSMLSFSTPKVKLSNIVLFGFHHFVSSGPIKKNPDMARGAAWPHQLPFKVITHFREGILSSVLVANLFCKLCWQRPLEMTDYFFTKLYIPNCVLAVLHTRGDAPSFFAPGGRSSVV